MHSAAECRAKAEEMEKQAREGPESMRDEWLVMAGHWRALEASASYAERVRQSLN